MRKIILYSIVGYLLMSCATHEGTFSASCFHRKVKYEDISIGTAKTSIIFGFGGLSKDALVLEAKRNMMRTRPLKGSEQYANYTLDRKTTFYTYFLIQTKVTLTADVVSFTNDSLADPYTDKYKSRLLGKSFANNLFIVDDSVIFENHNKSAIILAFDKGNKVKLLYRTEADNLKTKSVCIYDIYSKSKSYNGQQVGGRFAFTETNKKTGAELLTSAKIVGLGLKTLLVKPTSGKIKKMAYNSNNQ